ncbi:MAG: ATP-grasp domain-containing protein [Micrococcales bacterium]|nr:ATP-grasp domain-containing protein [Micrococcales bacterium]MCL2668254.1 ATP-grasp domain-containing protein [Micrococcales bacterium]
MPLTTVLIANRGEIAVRIARACRDVGLRSVAVYAESDRNALHVRLADQAFSLGGTRPGDTYLDVGKLLDVASRSGADAVHPGYGFLAENASFAQAVTAAGLAWIGPPPAAIEALGDKVSARRIAARAGAPLIPGTPDPVAGAEQIHQFVAQHGLPVAIKAAFGGGGRGLKVARSVDEVDEAYASAVREATIAFGRGECFVERYLDHPRHVETQCLADTHGNVVVVSTRDCSLQRRHQKLVEEAPAPFLTPQQEQTLVDASVAILREAGYVGAGTCEFLLGDDGAVSFLEVNTRLQVEHPVSEEVTGLDLVREQFRIAAGEPLGYDHVTTRGHCIELRINGEDPAVGFLPAPGTITTLRLPAGPGVRVDSGVVEGDNVDGVFDSLLLKLIVTGSDRAQAVARARRALDELVVEGVATVAPFHRAVLADPAFVPPDDEPFTVHTRWIETEFADRLADLVPTPSAEGSGDTELERVVVEVAGKRLEVVLPVALAAIRGGTRPRPAIRRPAPRAAHGTDALTSPMQGTIVTVAVAEGDQVALGDLIVVLEAMKMEQPLVAHRDGVVTGLSALPGAAVSAGSLICKITDPS